MADDIIDHYRRLLARYPGGLEQAMCVTYAQGIDEDGFIQAFGGDPAATQDRTLEQLDKDLSAYRYDQVPYTLLVSTVGDWLIGIEDNGFQGSRSEVMRGVSAGGSAVSVYWNVNATNRFTYNVAGRRVTGFDMFDTDRRWGSDPDGLSSYLGDLPWEDLGTRWPCGLALAERVTGVRLDEEILAGPFRRAFLTEVPEDLIPEGAEDAPALAHPFVRAVVAEPTVAKLPAITRFVARMIAEEAGIQHEPAVREALEILDERASGRRAPAADALRQRLDGLADEQRAAQRRGPEPDADAFRRMHAVYAVAGALLDDPAEAAFKAYWSGGYSLRDRGAVLVNAVLSRCRVRAVRDAAAQR